MRLKDFKNIHQGDRVFILGNGPSLQRTPLEKLNDEYTIALNKISKIYSETDWRPSYFVFHDAVHDSGNDYGLEIINSDMNEDTIKSIKSTIDLGIPCFLSEPGREWFNVAENCLFYTPKTVSTKKQLRVIEQKEVQSVWTTDITSHITCFASTITVAAQIAFYMGFDRMYFIGCDLYEPTRKQRLIFPDAKSPDRHEFSGSNKISNFAEIMKRSDRKLNTLVNTIQVYILRSMIEKARIAKNLPIGRLSSDNIHFTDDYGPDKERSSHSMNDQMRRAHKLIKFASQEYGFEVFNATLGGHLEIYERVRLDSVL